MQSYAVFAGGGVKGAALAGGFDAAQKEGFDFIGYGGTSAGSIVATLAAFGFSGDAIGNLMISTDFTKFLDDEGVQLTKLRQISERFSADKGFRYWGYTKSMYGAVQIVRKYWTLLGLYQGDKTA